MPHTAKTDLYKHGRRMPSNNKKGYTLDRSQPQDEDDEIVVKAGQSYYRQAQQISRGFGEPILVPLPEPVEAAKAYVVVFVFTPDLRNVWLITKQKPDWQKGLRNGIGGKVEKGETFGAAAVRELKEESGLALEGAAPLLYVGKMQGTNNDGGRFLVKVYTLTTLQELRTMESEPINLYRVKALPDLATIGNVQALVELCRYRLAGNSHFGEFNLLYNS